MATCQLCRNPKISAAWAWQPFGPKDSVICFTPVGSHYAGFPAIKICDDCYQDIIHSPDGVYRVNGRHSYYFIVRNSKGEILT